MPTWRIITTDPDTGEEHESEAPTRRVARELAQGLKAISPRVKVRITCDVRTAQAVPPCLAGMGCLCAGHARGNDAAAPCDTREGEVCDEHEAAYDTDRAYNEGFEAGHARRSADTAQRFTLLSRVVALWDRRQPHSDGDAAMTLVQDIMTPDADLDAVERALVAQEAGAVQPARHKCPRCASECVPARNYGREVKPRRWWCADCGWLESVPANAESTP